MIAKVFLFAFLSLQSSNAKSATRNAALEGKAPFDVLNEPTTYNAAGIGSKKAISGIEDLNSPKVQTNGDGSQIPILLPSGEDAVIQRPDREINVIIPIFPPSPPPTHDIKSSCTIHMYIQMKGEICEDLR